MCIGHTLIDLSSPKVYKTCIKPLILQTYSTKYVCKKITVTWADELAQNMENKITLPFC